MTCSSRFAEAWEFAAFWCVGALVTGAHDGGMADPALSDGSMNFPGQAVEANKGMVLYNLTQNTSGPVTGVTTSTLTATGVTWDTGDLYRIVPITLAQINAIEMHLDIVAGNIFAALAARAACDCTWQSWVDDFMKKLNIIEAGALYDCPCGNPRLTDAEKDTLFTYVNDQLERLRNGELVVCVGDTAKDYPAVGYAEIAHTDAIAAQIILNRIDREGSE